MEGLCVFIERRVISITSIWITNSFTDRSSHRRTDPAHSARSSLVVTHPSIDRGRRNLTLVNESLSYSIGRHREPYEWPKL